MLLFLGLLVRQISDSRNDSFWLIYPFLLAIQKGAINIKIIMPNIIYLIMGIERIFLFLSTLIRLKIHCGNR